MNTNPAQRRPPPVDVLIDGYWKMTGLQGIGLYCPEPSPGMLSLA